MYYLMAYFVIHYKNLSKSYFCPIFSQKMSYFCPIFSQKMSYFCPIFHKKCPIILFFYVSYYLMAWNYECNHDRLKSRYRSRSRSPRIMMQINENITNWKVMEIVKNYLVSLPGNITD